MDDFEFDIRYSSMEDGEHMLRWLTDPQDLEWYPFFTLEETQGAVKNWIGFSKYQASLTATVENKPCGVITLYLMPYRKVAHHSMFYVVVEKKYRKKGIGFSLIKNIMNLAKNTFLLDSVNCEVYEGCALIPILKKMDFQLFAKQEDYVKEQSGYKSRLLYGCFL